MSWPHIAYVNSNLRCALRLVYVAWAQLAFLHGYCFLHHRLLLSHALLDGCWVLRCDFPSMVWWRFECTWLTRWLKPRAWRATPGCQSSRLHLRARMTRETHIWIKCLLWFLTMFSSLFSLMKYETSRHSTECFVKSSGGSPSAYRQLISNFETHKSVHTRIITVSATSIEYSASLLTDPMASSLSFGSNGTSCKPIARLNTMLGEKLRSFLEFRSNVASWKSRPNPKPRVCRQEASLFKTTN